jgi:hypothetical protein
LAAATTVIELAGEVNWGEVHALTVLESLQGLGPGTSLEATVGVDPELIGAEVLEHLIDAVLDLLLAGNTGPEFGGLVET